MIFPVGQAAGPNVVRVGRQAEHLSDAEFKTWDLAHETADEALPHADELVRRGLLVRVDDTTAFAQQYRLLPLFIGLGNHPDEPDRFAIGVQGLAPLAVVDERTYELWQWGWVAPSLWAHCEVQATLGQQPRLLQSVATLLAEYVAVLEPVS